LFFPAQCPHTYTDQMRDTLSLSSPLLFSTLIISHFSFSFPTPSLVSLSVTLLMMIYMKINR